MSRSVHSFTFRDTVLNQEIEMPAGAEVVAVGEQDGTFILWAIVTLEAPLVKRCFCLVETGDLLEEDVGKYIGTVQLLSETLVYHVFEVWLPGARPNGV